MVCQVLPDRTRSLGFCVGLPRSETHRLVQARRSRRISSVWRLWRHASCCSGRHERREESRSSYILTCPRLWLRGIACNLADHKLTRVPVDKSACRETYSAGFCSQPFSRIHLTNGECRRGSGKITSHIRRQGARNAQIGVLIGAVFSECS